MKAARSLSIGGTLSVVFMKRSLLLLVTALFVVCVVPAVARLQGVAADSPVWQVIASPKTVPHLRYISTLAVDSRHGPSGGRWLYAGDGYDHRIFKLDLTGRFYREWSYPAGAAHDIQDGIAVDSSGRVWVANTGKLALEVFSPNGKLLHTYGYLLAQPYARTAALTWAGTSSVAFDGSGNAASVSTATGQLDRFDPHGHVWETSGMGTNLLSLAFMPPHRLYVVQHCNAALANNPTVKHCTNGRDYNYWVNELDLTKQPGNDQMSLWYGSYMHGGTEEGAQPWVSLRNIGTDGFGSWYVTGMIRHGAGVSGGIVEFSRTGARSHVWTVPGRPSGLAFDGAGRPFFSSGNRIYSLGGEPSRYTIDARVPGA